MTQLSIHTPPLRSLSFQLSDITRVEQLADWHSTSTDCTMHTLLVFERGSGSLHINQTTFEYMAGKSYLVSPGTSLRVDSDGSSEICVYRIAFTIIQTHSDGEHLSYSQQLFPGRFEISTYPWSRLLRMIEELYAGKPGKTEMEWYTQQVRFVQLMGFILEHNLRSNHSQGTSQSVQNTIQYMQNNYMNPITVKQLAQLANVSQWRYTPIFQELTGRRPLDYLTELRITRAKELLSCSDQPLREIAERVGFTDEYYFNRRFRHTTGITPKQYARRMQGKVRVKDWTGHEVDIPVTPQRIIYHGETYGDLVALGVKAVGGSSYFIQGTICEEYVHRIEDVGHPCNPHASRMLEPDLIIMANEDESLYRSISQIAPTVTFNSFAPLDQRLHTLGSLLGKQREAQQWLDTYTAKENAMWRELRAHIKPGETASVFIYDHGDRLFVMGTTGLSSALYHPVGFRPVDKIQHILDSGSGFMEINSGQVADYAGDRIFMLINGNELSRQATRRLMCSDSWQQLSAVRAGYVYQVNALHWNLSDALTRERLLQALPLLLSQTS
ncbi:AraC family transcriptional regulator [Paenibacillus sp. UMB4589-SE434]|uniref:AraC family transcriptional regulator n=1 Tax=Paenibacillus sp. UMB4589-SE434 TaxID=3046314 RepID=UPI00254CAD1F|nr:AraC family transcriptional regulator [Paenibacillus sp. UMB4589-SE434]MDK8180541.1 AraC family transcriptional regulator [Paenibacillus sp. UMB4589-SE434]